MKNNSDLISRLNSVLGSINCAVDNDNIITEKEYLKIQELKHELNVTAENIHDLKKTDVDRILYLQFYLLLLDDNIDWTERKEVEYYREIFGYSEDEIMEIQVKVKKDKQEWFDYKLGMSHLTHNWKDHLSESERRNRSIPESIKKVVWDRDGGKCVLCGSKDNLEFDHDIPFSQGGSNSTQNIRVLCRNCNRKKSDYIGLINDEN